jgi:predicted metalloprotease
MGCGVLFALLVIVVVLALTFGAPTFLGTGQETPIEQPTTTQNPSSPPDETTEQKKQEEEDTSQTVTIRVTGWPGVAFSGGYASAGGSYSSIEGVTPQDFELEVRTEADGVAANV